MKLLRILFTFTILVSLSSCMVSKNQFGNYNNEEASKVYLKSKDVYLFWDLILLQNTDKKLNIEDYEKTIKRSFFDNVVYYGTLGIFSFYTVKIKVNKESLLQNY